MKDLAVFLFSVFFLSTIVNAVVISVFLGGLSPGYRYGLALLACLTGASAPLAAFLVVSILDVIERRREREIYW
jgi:Na+/pantothenate symporter